MNVPANLVLSADVLDRIVDAVVERLRDRPDAGDWYTPNEYAAKGWATTADAARRRGYRLERKGSADVQRVAGRLLLRGPKS